MALSCESLETDISLESLRRIETVRGIDDRVIAAVEDRNWDRQGRHDVIERMPIESVEESVVEPFAGVERPLPVTLDGRAILVERPGGRHGRSCRDCRDAVVDSSGVKGDFPAETRAEQDVRVGIEVVDDVAEISEPCL